jgi:hypothetical protein
MDHRMGVTGNPETCSCILRTAWPNPGSWPKGQTLTYGNGEFCSFTTVLAVRRGHFGCLKYAVENGCRLDNAIYREDVRTPQQFQCIEYVLQLGLPIDVDGLAAACRDSNSAYLKILIEAQQRGHMFSEGGEIISHSPFDDGCIQNVVNNAHNYDAQKAQLCIEMLRQAGCSWDAIHTKDAAENGNFGLLKYLVEKGCPWHKETVASAEESGHKEMIEYATRHAHKLKQRANVARLFEALEINKQQMTEQEYIEAANAAKELHDSI